MSRPCRSWEPSSSAADLPLPFEHRRPEWLRVRAPWGASVWRVDQVVHGQGLHTVCEEARCPNRGECWGAGTATFLILGDVCTRDCRFCAVRHGQPAPADPEEPDRIARAVQQLAIRHAVLTSVTRDDLVDGGATAFARCIARLHAVVPDVSVEVLIPDFKGSETALRVVVEAGPDVLNHNLETVPRLYPAVRPKASYERSLALLEKAKRWQPDLLTKSGLMVGLGETRAEVEQVMRDLAAIGADILTIGQYLRPSRNHLPIQRYYRPEEFAELRAVGLAAGLRWVEAGPLVRSSYRALEQVLTLVGSRRRGDAERPLGCGLHS